VNGRFSIRNAMLIAGILVDDGKRRCVLSIDGRRFSPELKIPRCARARCHHGWRMAWPVSVSIVACNEERNLPRCLASVAGLATETVVMDSGSTDATCRIAADAGARVIHQDWLGYRDQKNAALARCTQPWVLALDADEELSPALRAEIEASSPRGPTSTGTAPRSRAKSGSSDDGSPTAIGIPTANCGWSAAREPAGRGRRNTIFSKPPAR
jgi:hypothetical protein